MITFDDLHVGRTFALGPYEVTAEEIVAFASEFDPQPFHLDGTSEQARGVGGLIASGWHTCSMAMRMMCDAYLLDSASQGAPGVENVRWLAPVRPGDVLTGTSTVTSARRSKSRPNIGIVVFDHELCAGDNVVLTMRNTGMMKVRA